jgi:hypothetical protein
MSDIVDTGTPVVEVAQAVAETIVNPSVGILAEDLMLVHSLVTDVKSKLAGKPINVKTMFSWLFNLEQ